MDDKRYGVVSVLGSYLVKVVAIHDTKDAAEADKTNHEQGFGTHVYPVEKNISIGREMPRNRNFEN